MVRSVLFLEPVNGDSGAIERFFEQEGVLQRAARTPGFLGAELQVSDEPSAPAMVTALWRSADAYRLWVDDPWRAANAERARSVYRAIEGPGGGGAIYELRITVTGPADSKVPRDVPGSGDDRSREQSSPAPHEGGSR